MKVKLLNVTCVGVKHDRLKHFGDYYDLILKTEP